MTKILRKVVSVLLGIAIISAPSTVALANERFPDVPAGAWYAQAVEYVQENGLFTGNGEGTFDPDGSMNRAMMVQVLANATENYKTRVSSADILPYSDVDPWAWYGRAIHWATDYQIASGKGNGKFAPFAAITREEAASMLFRYAQRIQNDTSHKGTSLKKFSDEKAVSPWATNAMDWAVEKGILKGYPDGTLRPGRTITRAEAAMVFFNAKDVLKNHTAIFPMTEIAEKLGITADSYPRVDGSKLTQSLADDLFYAMYGILNPYGISHSQTWGAYEKLIAGDTDLILVPAPDDALLQKAEAAGIELLGYEIGREGLTFLTLEENKAKNVTVDQLRQIYGDYSIKNWSALGGDDLPLLPFCGTSGLVDDRQMQLEQQILQGKPLNSEIQKQYAFENWNSVINCAGKFAGPDYDGFGIAPCGYAMYQGLPYLFTGMKLLTVNGIEPTEKNIADGTYPLTYSYYAVIRTDEPKDSPARKLAEWLQTKEGQELMAKNQFVKLFN